MAAVCGGTQSLHTNSYDEAIGLPTEESATIALRTQQIIAHESGAADVVDPLGGSHYVEYLTQEIYDGAMDIINTVEAKGGAMEAIKQGWQQQEIHNSAYKHLNDVESGERKIVGVNLGEMEELNQVSAMKVDMKLGDIQTEKLNKWRKIGTIYWSLKLWIDYQSLLKQGANLFPIVIDAVRNKCTLGEIMNCLKEEYGTWMAPSGF